MEKRLKIPYPVIVEGKYDKLRLQSVMEGQILTTDGFGLFNKKEKTMLFRALAKSTPVIVLTDSDGAGKLIRSHITGILPPERVIHLYIPRVRGTEKRKDAPSAEGTLGVEGMERELLQRLLEPYADPAYAKEFPREERITKLLLYEDGLTGGEGSREKRDALAARLELPPGMTPNALLAALQVLCTYERYCELVGREVEET